MKTALLSKMTMVRIIASPQRLLSRKNMTEYVLCCLKLVPLRGKNIFEPRPEDSNKTLVPFRVFFEYLRRTPPVFFVWESPPGPLLLVFITFACCFRIEWTRSITWGISSFPCIIICPPIVTHAANLYGTCSNLLQPSSVDVSYSIENLILRLDSFGFTLLR